MPRAGVYHLQYFYTAAAAYRFEISLGARVPCGHAAEGA